MEKTKFLVVKPPNKLLEENEWSVLCLLKIIQPRQSCEFSVKQEQKRLATAWAWCVCRNLL